MYEPDVELGLGWGHEPLSTGLDCSASDMRIADTLVQQRVQWPITLPSRSYYSVDSMATLTRVHTVGLFGICPA